MQSVAGFASLHCGITMLVALMVQYTVRIRWLRIAVWVNFGITAVATLYFGWHYIADDVAGVLIALVSFYVGGLASGQKFETRRAALAPDHHHLGGPGPARLSLHSELHRCSTSRRHADESEKSGRFGLTRAPDRPTVGVRAPQVTHVGCVTQRCATRPTRGRSRSRAV